MDDLINKLTNNFQYGNDLILFLIANDDMSSIHYLDYLNIKGKELDNFTKCLPEFSLQYIKETIRFLRSGFVSSNDIHANLNSKTPICFITRLLKIGENWEYAYEDFAGNFYTKFTPPKPR